MAEFKKALPAMNLMYASICGTAVIQLKDIPPRPPEYDGKITVLDLALSSDEVAVREDLGRFGEVVEVSVRADVPVRLSIPAPSTFVATARYASHAEAEVCISALREEKRRAFCIYNETHYSCERGYPYSGWCVRPCVALHTAP